MTQCLISEITSRAAYLENEPLETIYFGGGTPSLLTADELHSLLNTVREHYRIIPDPEITLEANPDDLTREKLRELRDAGINRLSIGLQTFDDGLLAFLNRAHDRKQAIECVERAHNAGFSNISLDLIYAIPGEPASRLDKDLAMITSLGAVHISTYGLTIEPDTAFGRWHRKGKLTPVDDDQAASDYMKIMAYLQAHGYEHYEISNFGKPGYHSRHNSSYWQQKKYLGIGPGAHSYNLESRWINVANNMKYMKGIEAGQPVFELEILTREDKINEFVLVALRTSAGIDLERLKQEYGYDLIGERGQYLAGCSDRGYTELRENRLKLTDKGKLLADQIAEDLFILPPG